MRLALLGTGIMGFPIARNLAATGLEVAAWNRTREKAEPLGDHGVEVIDDIAEATADADVVITMLTDGDAVLDVARRVDFPGEAIWLQMSTIGFDAHEECAGLADEAGVTYVDAPVLGTKKPAEDGALIVLASGPDEARKRCDPIFDSVGSRTQWLGDAGEGQRLKVVINAWITGLVETLAETIALAEGTGVDPTSFLETIEGGPMDSVYAQMKGSAMIDRKLDPSFPLRLAAKDADLILEAADNNDLSLPLLEAVYDQMRAGVEAGHGDEDLAATIRVSSPRD